MLGELNTDFKLAELLSSAGATIGIIIAATIFLQMVHSRSTDLLQRYRTSTGEYRTKQASNERRTPLEVQIRMFRLRLRLIDSARWLAIVAVPAMVVAVLRGGVENLFSSAWLVKVVGAGAIAAGLLLIGSALLLHLMESIYGRHEIGREADDLSALAKDSGMKSK
jgi:hypothetical protein